MITTVTTITAMGLTAAISAVTLATLMVFLATRELAGASNSRLSWRIARFASVGILPLVTVFAAIVIVRIAEVL